MSAFVIKDKEHAKLSPSGSKRWITCPGSIRLVDSLNLPNTSSKWAAEGTVAHEVHEKCLLNDLDAISFFGTKMESDGVKFTVSENMVDAVQESLDYIRGRIKEAEDFGLRVEMLVEVRSSLKFLNIPGLDGGTADVVLLFWDGDICVEIEIIDYKHGQGVAVEVEFNTQAMCYALGIIYLPKLNGHGIHEGVRVTISQPRAHHIDGRIRSWYTDKEYLRNWEEDTLIPAALETMKDDAQLIPSDSGCRFCGASGVCSAQYNKTQEVAMVDFTDDSFVDPKTMTAEQKKSVMDHAAMIRSFVVAVEAQVQHEVDNGSKDYEGSFKLVRKTTHRKFTEEALDPDFSPLLDHLEHCDLFVEKPKALGAIEKKLKEVMGKEDTKELMKKLTTKPEGSLVIAPITDKRKSVAPSIISDFENL